MAGEQTSPTQDDPLNLALEAFDDGGVGAAVAAMKAIDDPAQASSGFDRLSRKLYNARTDVTNMIAVAEAGIAFCLDQAQRTDSSEIARELKTTAKTIAFNAGANCWPGWGDDGIDIAPTHIRSGVKLAEVCRDLVAELQLGHKQAGNAIWLIGALKLAAGDPTAALDAFQQARGLAEAGGNEVGVRMAAGYCALARKADAATAPAGAQELELALMRLRELDSKEANFFVQQLVTADRILLAK
jgi:hypothetical protein